jgi:hypothetical protein
LFFFSITLVFVLRVSVSGAASINLFWDSPLDPDIAAYKIYYGTTSGSYAYSVNVEGSQSCTISGLQEGETWYFAATSLNSGGLESDPCQEISYTVPVSPPPVVDTDGDGISDADETNLYGTDPSNPDTDGDGIEDGTEISKNSDPNSKPAAGQKIWLEAESGSLGAPMKSAADGSASSGSYIWVPEGQRDNYGTAANGGSAKYRFQIDEEGDYLVWGRILAANDQSDSFFVAVDSGSYARWDVPRAQGWSWDVAASVHLAAGEHTLTILNREDGTRLDRILITSDAAYVPAGAGETVQTPPPPPPATGQIWLEAESGTLSAPMKSASDAAASAGKYIWVPEGQKDNYGTSVSGGLAAYRLQIAQAGNYRIWGRILTGGGQSDSFFTAVDNGAYSRWDVPPASKWSWAVARTVTLTAGEHTLKILNREDGTKMDRILVTNDLAYMPK